MPSAEKKSFNSPDETRRFNNGIVEIVKLGEGTVGRTIFQPGWRWSTDVKPIAKTELCEAPHVLYCVSGRMHVVMGDGTEFEVGPGDVGSIPPGHDAWVVGDQPCVGVDWSGMENYAK